MRDASDDRKTRRDIKREATRIAVLEAARRVFLAEGYEGATIKAIAETAQVSPGTVLNAAPSKASLLVEILQDEAETMRGLADRLEASLTGDVRTRLEALLQLILESKLSRADLFAAAVGHTWLLTDPAYHETFEHMEAVWAIVRRALERGVEAGELRAGLDAERATALLQDMLLGVLRCQRRHGPEFAPEAELRARLEVLTPALLQEA
ncbi:TetR/AcrR family transcriptional regulator [Marinicauda salina]|jgi:AcrR family transcriptional regulator|uniref:TetR/AcrR family transcriptional regulator n=1 Tax=Marinicauda salina TaxID=2135793 RepID=A0A2U2BQS9_9PROT|nr:TetR/AcrR family transcriptional regulator [Marinicauda salina]PWE16361.1 TetR/AcrR family transcriptional regulator [Marinicauda salina]